MEEKNVIKKRKQKTEKRFLQHGTSAEQARSFLRLKGFDFLDRRAEIRENSLDHLKREDIQENHLDVWVGMNALHKIHLGFSVQVRTRGPPHLLFSVRPIIRPFPFLVRGHIQFIANGRSQ